MALLDPIERGFDLAEAVADAGLAIAARRRRGGADRAGGDRIGHGAERGGALLERRLAAHQIVELLLELLLVEQLAAGRAVDLRAQFGDAVLIGELLLGLMRDQGAQHVVAKGEIGGRGNRPAGHDHQGADADPERHRSEPDLPAAMGKRISRARRLRRRALLGVGAIAVRLRRLRWRDVSRAAAGDAQHAAPGGGLAAAQVGCCEACFDRTACCGRDAVHCDIDAPTQYGSGFQPFMVNNQQIPGGILPTAVNV